MKLSEMGYLTLIAVIVVFHEPLGHPDGLLLRCRGEKRKEYDCYGQLLPGILL